MRQRLGGSLQRRIDGLTEQLGGPARRRVILLLASVLALNSADNGALGAVAIQLEPGLHIDNVQLGLLITVSSLVGAVAAIPVGALTDKTRRVRLLSISIAVWGAAEALSGFSTSFTMLVLVRLALGAVAATAGPAVASLTGDFFPAGERGRVYGYIITGELAGAAFGVIVAALVSSWLGWRAAFVVLAAPSIVLVWALLKYLPEPARGGQSRLEPGAARIVSADQVDEGATPTVGRRRGAGGVDDLVLSKVEEQGVEPDENIVIAADPSRMSTWQVVRYVLRVRTNVVIIVASSLGYFFFGGLRTFAIIFIRGHFGIGQALAAVLLVVIGAGAAIGLLGAGRVADGLIRRGRTDARLIVGAAGYLAAAALLLPALLSGNLAFSLLLLVLAAAAIAAPNPPLDAARLDVVPAQLWGRAEGVRTALRNTLEAFAPLLFGLLAAQFGATQASFGSSAGQTASAAGASQAHGLQVAFLLMLIPLAAAGVVLLVTRRYYAVDVASAGESERRAATHARPQA